MPAFPAGQRKDVTSPLTRPRSRSRSTAVPARPVLRQAARFLLVGGAATVVDVGAFNLFHYGLGVGPLSAKVVATVLGGAAAFVGNRQWSFRGAADRSWRTQAGAFLAVNLVALVLALLPLAIARYALGLTGVVALNVAGNGIGLVLATALRFWGYRRWVFPPAAVPTAAPAAAAYERLAA